MAKRITRTRFAKCQKRTMVRGKTFRPAQYFRSTRDSPGRGKERRCRSVLHRALRDSPRAREEGGCTIQPPKSDRFAHGRGKERNFEGSRRQAYKLMKLAQECKNGDKTTNKEDVSKTTTLHSGASFPVSKKTAYRLMKLAKNGCKDATSEAKPDNGNRVPNTPNVASVQRQKIAETAIATYRRTVLG